MPIPETEDIARAICSDKYDGERISPSLFTGTDTSVSRLALASLADSWDLFRNNVEKPPERVLELIGTINVGNLAEVGRAHDPNKQLTVEPDPLDGFPSHAIIPQKITRGLANKILKEIGVHKENG